MKDLWLFASNYALFSLGIALAALSVSEHPVISGVVLALLLSRGVQDICAADHHQTIRAARRAHEQLPDGWFSVADVASRTLTADPDTVADELARLARRGLLDRTCNAEALDLYRFPVRTPLHLLDQHEVHT